MAIPKEKPVVREEVSVGLDFTPIPLKVGDGTEWLFNPEPSPAKFGALADACGAFSALEDDQTNVGTTMVELAEKLSDALIAMMDPGTPGQDKKFRAREYGLRSLNWFATQLVERSTGFPTT